jgi:hypothetical protein
MATTVENIEALAGVLDTVQSIDDVKSNSKDAKSSQEKKSLWRDIERMRDKVRLIKALKEIDPNFDPNSTDSYMEF